MLSEVGLSEGQSHAVEASPPAAPVSPWWLASLDISRPEPPTDAVTYKIGATPDHKLPASRNSPSHKTKSGYDDCSENAHAKDSLAMHSPRLPVQVSEPHFMVFLRVFPLGSLLDVHRIKPLRTLCNQAATRPKYSDVFIM
jgi:hypothetical protein